MLAETTPLGAAFDCKSASAAGGGNISAAVYSESRLRNSTITERGSQKKNSVVVVFLLIFPTTFGAKLRKEMLSIVHHQQ